MGLMWILPVIFIIVLLIVLKRSNQIRDIENDNALDVLRERYAKGEINEAEFEKRKRELQK